MAKANIIPAEEWVIQNKKKAKELGDKHLPSYMTRVLEKALLVAYEEGFKDGIRQQEIT